MTVAIIDYGSGNLRSAEKAFERAARETGVSVDIRVTNDPDFVRRADRVVLPGVGAFGDCRRGLGAIDGMIEALTDVVIGKGRPFLGICVGMQLLARRGFEHGEHAGLGWIDGEVAEINPTDASLKIPHMGWNELQLHQLDHPLFAGFAPGDHAYFVHSYAMQHVAPDQVLATCEYGGPVVAAVGHDNIAGTQFHPEKSQAVGLRLIGNFLTWRP